MFKRIVKTLHRAETPLHLVYYGAAVFKFDHAHEWACVALFLILIPLVADLND